MAGRFSLKIGFFFESTLESILESILESAFESNFESINSYSSSSLSFVIKKRLVEEFMNLKSLSIGPGTMMTLSSDNELELDFS